MKLVLSSTGGLEDANKKQYVLLITGTMNPPHRGHVLIGLRAAAALRAEGHSVTAVCFVPVHDNYLCNKARVSGGNTLFLNMAQRCAMLELLVRAEGEDAALCHVIDYEGEHGSELLEDRPHSVLAPPAWRPLGDPRPRHQGCLWQPGPQELHVDLEHSWSRVVDRVRPRAVVSLRVGRRSDGRQPYARTG